MATFKTFRLTRYFSVLSMALILVAGGVLGLSARHQATQQVNKMAEGHNEAMGQVFINQLWPEFSVLLADSTGRSGDALRADARMADLQERTATLMARSHIIKVKVYNRDGLTVFSSDPRQIGEDKRGNAGFQAALAGRSASELTHRNQFDSFEGTLSDIEVVSSYLPLPAPDRVTGVLEVYQDVTPAMHNLGRVLLEVVVSGSLVMVVLYLVQLLVVRYAQEVLRNQEERLVESNRELDARVAERTAELGTINDKLQEEVAERKRAETRLEHLAHHDPLTGLPNRLLFTEQLPRSVGNAQRHKHQVGVLFIDLDRFKEVNDTMGHSAGDELLREVSTRLSQHLRSGDLLARLGGDEFVCVLENLQAPFEASQVAEKLIACVASPMTLRGHEVRISASIGISLYPADGTTPDDLLRAADTAMYQAKKHGRNTYHFYTPEMTQSARERAQLDRLLRHAITNNELDVHYQIKMALGSQATPSGAEALVRWTNPELGAVPPARFIPIAEESGYIVELGEWVLRQACSQLALWRAQGVDIPQISVNLSVRQLERADILETVRSALQENGLAPEMLELEITESVIMDADDAISVMKQLSELGVRLAVDDFGTGYSSLSYLKLLPIQTLKIDRSFVVGIGDNGGDESIIRAVIGMAQSLGLSTVAEGVETLAQLAFLQQAGCEQIQGYLFGKPQPADVFLEGWNARPLT
ncbi:putative bifunctional diguanylate cyclase/phosphodiesterase [Rhodoferax saidenbachensis]|uniref:GGDEF-domain containing protein n=1 Tax=Rhodoferax saidenbachensis TaxID=1484693 RepID=A0A1P8KDX1_9BURK|nr:EAL domain-containing protein [Rhodoferax saidenbachensis]APW44128.1 hypothetical protein RS694_17405 [Rhodoferax saidenbachensis]